MKQNARLDGGNFFAFVHRLGRRPSLTAISRALEVHPPTAFALRAGGRKNVAVRQLHRFVLTGPRIPSGKRRGVDQVFPSSSVEVVTMPHQVAGLGPTL